MSEHNLCEYQQPLRLWNQTWPGLGEGGVLGFLRKVALICSAGFLLLVLSSERQRAWMVFSGWACRTFVSLSLAFGVIT